MTGLYNEEGNRTPENAEVHIDSVGEGESVETAGARRHESINEVSEGASMNREFGIQNADSGNDYGVNAYEGEVRLLTVDPIGLPLCRTHNGAEWTEDDGSVDYMDRNYRGVTFDYVESTWHIDEVGFLGSIDFYNDYAYTTVAGDYYNYNFGGVNERTDVSHWIDLGARPDGNLDWMITHQEEGESSGLLTTEIILNQYNSLD